MKKKEFIKLLDKFDDNDELDLWIDEDEDQIPRIVSMGCLELEAYSVYDKIIKAIAEGERCDWQEICDTIHLSNLDSISLLGVVKNVHPEVKNGEVHYRIDKDEITNGMYKSAFEPQSNGAYWTIQHCQSEDWYYGQLLIPLGYTGWMVLSYSCERYGRQS